MPLRVLLLADTHLGFDLPWKPRVERRRRGPDFFANYERALQPALRGEVDLVVHGGDVARLVDHRESDVSAYNSEAVQLWVRPVPSVSATATDGSRITQGDAICGQNYACPPSGGP